MARKRKTVRWTLPRARRRIGTGPVRLRRLLVLAAVVAALAAMDRLGWGVAGSDDMAKYHGRTLFVVRVVDGDTLDVSIPDGEELFTRVRLWGIDAPEIAKPWESAEASQPGGEEAKAALTAWTDYELVSLELLPYRMRDKFGRVLAFVRDVHGTCLNEQLVRAGHARADGRWWHPQRERYEVMAETARRNRLGMWGNN